VWELSKRNAESRKQYVQMEKRRNSEIADLRRQLRTEQDEAKRREASLHERINTCTKELQQTQTELLQLKNDLASAQAFGQKMEAERDWMQVRNSEQPVLVLLLSLQKSAQLFLQKSTDRTYKF
jgi:chromosome segregation ATPase